MSQQQPIGPNGQRLHIAHRRSPSELTPLMMEQLALAQQLNALQNMQNGLLGIPGNQSISQQGFSPGGGIHSRNPSAFSSFGGSGPPPAPSSGFSTGFNQNRHENVNPRNRGGGNGGGANSGHNRRHSLALNEAKRAAEVAEQRRKNSQFQFPPPPSDASSSTQSPSVDSASLNLSTPLSRPSDSSSSSLQPPSARGGRHGRSQSSIVTSRGGGTHNRAHSNVHARSGSNAIDGNWRFPASSATGNTLTVPTTSSMVSQPTLMNTLAPTVVNPAMFSLPPGAIQLAQLQALQQQFNGQYLGLPQFAPQYTFQPQIAVQQPQHSQNQHSQNQNQQNQQQQQQRKTLFTPYLPQASLPQLLEQGHLVSGVLRVNKKNRSDAYVTCPDLDADIFICGSKDRNRALEGDLVAVELLDVDEVWNQKREKEEKKKRKDNGDTRSIAVNDATTQPESSSATDGGIRRRGSLKQRPTQKKNDDVEVEGQSLLLMEEDEINDDQKPLYAGHIVAVIERIAGQMFSGTLGLLRPSSQATKEKQDAERAAREGSHMRYQPERQERPKIVWFKPTDKRVPLIAIPTEQAPRDFVDRHADYANRIFVACIKRWPITSLHPFGSLIEQLGEMGDLNVETDALLRDNNFGSDTFSDAVLNSVGFMEWSVDTEDGVALSERKDFREEFTFTVDPNGTKELDHAVHVKLLDDPNLLQVGVHVADVAYFIKSNSLVDREAKKRGTAVYLMNRTVNMLPPHLAWNICCLSPDQDRFTVTVTFVVDRTTGDVLEDRTWVGKSIIKSRSKLSYSQVDAVLSGQDEDSLDPQMISNIKLLEFVTDSLRRRRFGTSSKNIPSLRLLHLLDDENVPVERNIFDSSSAHGLVEELLHTVNTTVATKIYEGLGPKAFLRRQAAPNPRRLQALADRMKRLGFEFDATSSGTIQSSIFDVSNDNIRRGMETLLVKTMGRAKYFVAGKQAEDQYGHFAFNLPLYTHFTGPSRRYADLIVHRQLEAVLLGQNSDSLEDLESLSKTAETCNTKKDSASNAQEQSVHIEACRAMDKRHHQIGGDLISEGIVLCVYESAFDVLIPEWGFEKRVHCDQLPLKKAEFDKNGRVLELYWEKGVPSSTYIPEDERPKPAGGSSRQHDHYASAAPTITTTTVTSTDDDLFDYDEVSDASSVSDLGAGIEGVSLNESSSTTARKSVSRTKSDSKLSGSSDITESKMTNKDRLFKLLSLRQESGEHIQTIRELSSIPVILRTDMSKSPPCLTIRSINPYSM